MKQLFTPWGYALRSLALYAPQGPRTPNVPVVPPLGLEPPAPLPDAENGYVALAKLVGEWPFEGHTAPDLLHRLKALPKDRKAAERALAPLRSILERAEPLLEAPRWQVLVKPGEESPELPMVRRLAQAFLLRGALDGQEEDRRRTLEIARRLRRSQSPMMHFVVGLALERSAGGDLSGLEEDRAEAIRWEFARYIVPAAHTGGPWNPTLYALPASWADDERAIRWLLADHPQAYDPGETIAALVANRELMERGSSSALRSRAEEFGAAWPPAMRPGGQGPMGGVPLLTLHRARPILREVPNAFGLLQASRILHATAGVVQAVEQAQESVKPPLLY